MTGSVPEHSEIAAAAVQEYADAAAAALNLLRAEDWPFTERVDRLAEMCAAWLEAADRATAPPPHEDGADA